MDTIQGVLNYKRSGSDSKVTWSPPSALRRIDLILLDEASQYEDQEWDRFFKSVKEQPHSPYVVTVADFKQLQPVVSGKDGKGSLCQKFCEKMQKVELKTVYRTADEQHLVFLNRIRETQPDKAMLHEYFASRHWRHRFLEDCVRIGMQLEEDAGGHPFTWLTVTNAGAAEVSQAALRMKGIEEDDLRAGSLCDPATKSDLRILARPGVLLRLSRNLDKSRGFVNGALAEVCESLDGNTIFTARLKGTGNMVLVHPMHEKDTGIFLPCCYGYATTIRRAQGADLYHGCIYFNQHKFPAARGYGYVAASRFKSRAGCYLYGKLRRSDFLPVGDELESEVLERGYESLSSEDSDGAGLEYAFGSDEECESIASFGLGGANRLNDFV